MPRCGATHMCRGILECEVLVGTRSAADRIAAPRGTRWNASTINSNNARGHGMLLNELYAGRIVWNKVRMVKDPTTGQADLANQCEGAASNYRGAATAHHR